MSANGTKEQMAAQGEKMNKLEAEENAKSETVDFLKEQVWRSIVARKFVGQWKFAETTGKWRDYVKEFGGGFLFSLYIHSIGKIIIFFFDVLHIK